MKFDAQQVLEGTHEISYRTAPDGFSNSAILSLPYLEQVVEGVFSDRIVCLADLLALGEVLQAVVLCDRLILVDDAEARQMSDITGPRLPEDDWSELYESNTMKVVRRLVAADAIVDDNVAELLTNEAQVVTPGRIDAQVSVVHQSHLVVSVPEEPRNSEFGMPSHIYDDEAHLARIYIAAKENLDPMFLAELQRSGAMTFSELGYIPVPWSVLARCHGAPLVDGTLRTSKATSEDAPTTIGIKLYQKLEEWHHQFFREIKSILGPTYINVPPLLNMVLNRAQKPSGLLKAAIELRHDLTGFISQCTRLEYDLRTVQTIGERIQIVRDVQLAWNVFEKKYGSPKKKALSRTLDVVKQVDPLKMLGQAARELYDYDLERQALVRVNRLVDLFELSLEVREGEDNLRRIFGPARARELITELDRLEKGDSSVLTRGPNK